MRTLFMVLLLSACASEVAPKSHQVCSTQLSLPGWQPVVPYEEVYSNWQEFFDVTLPTMCDKTPPWFYAADEDYYNYCSKPSVACTWIFSGSDCVYTIVRSSYRASRNVAVHETAHWLLYCSGKASDGDVAHTTYNVWNPTGFVDTTAKAVP